MNDDGDRQVVQCNYIEATGVAAVGARAYVVRTNPGNANDRIVVLVYSRGARWVEKWENTARLGNFRVKTLPPEHPLYASSEWWADPQSASRLLATSAQSEANR